MARKINTPLELITKSVTVQEYFTGVIRKGNLHSSRINIPIGYEGKHFILAILPDDGGVKHE